LPSAASSARRCCATTGGADESCPCHVITCEPRGQGESLVPPYKLGSDSLSLTYDSTHDTRV
jgi:hypothetical protein